MTHRMQAGLLTVLPLVFSAASAAAPLTAPHHDITLDGASRLLDAAMTACHAGGKRMAAAVVDRGGNLVALRRDDGVGPHNTAAAQRKAYTALSTKTATRLLAANAHAGAESANLVTVDSLLLLGGGVPLKVDGETVGAIGIAGAGGPAEDEACAMSAVDSGYAVAAPAAAPAPAPAPAPATAVNPLSVHVLNLQDGLPSAGVAVTLEQRVGEQWTMLNEGVTNAQGRIPALFPAGAVMARGTYRVIFKTGKWFADHKSASFFPEIPVIFSADGSVPHYHVPLLLSPYGYSTYRGN